MFEKRCARKKPRHFFSAQYVMMLAGLPRHRYVGVGVRREARAGEGRTGREQYGGGGGEAAGRE